MNYYDARKETDADKWAYTSLNRRSGTHPVGYCSGIIDCTRCTTGFGQPGCPECGGEGFTRKEVHHHDSEDAARACFRRYLLDGAREETYADWTGCRYEGCDTPTKKGLTTRPPLGTGEALCDVHRTYEVLVELTPTPGQITASY